MRTGRSLKAGLTVVSACVAAVSAQSEEIFVPKLMLGSDSAYVRLYGQFNPGLLYPDDGNDSDWYFVNNANSSPRFGVLFHRHFDNDVTLGANYEFQYDPYSSTYVNQINGGDPDWDRYLTRKAEIYTGGAFGKIWAGQGSMASDGTAEIDLSGTSVIGYSSVSDLAGGQLFAFKDLPGLSSIDVGGAFMNFDGASRKLRVRYDTPTIAGFVLSASYGSQEIPVATGEEYWDAALRYAGEFGALRVAGGVAYSDNFNGEGRVDGSVSILHTPTGLSLTGAAAEDGLSDRDNPTYLYGKVGYQQTFFAAGKTAFSADIYSGDDIVTPGSESSSWGLQAVQNFDYYQMQTYVGYRVYEYSDDAAKYKHVRAVLAGVRAKF